MFIGHKFNGNLTQWKATKYDLALLGIMKVTLIVFGITTLEFIIHTLHCLWLFKFFQDRYHRYDITREIYIQVSKHF